MEQSQSCRALNEFYNYIKEPVWKESKGCPNCKVFIECESKTGTCGIMVCEKSNDSVLYISCNKEIVSFLGDSEFYSNTTNFEYSKGKLVFNDKKNRKVKITKI